MVTEAAEATKEAVEKKEKKEDSKQSEEESKAEKSPGDLQRERYQLIQDIINKETFIDPLSGEEIARAYAAYDRNPEKIIKVLIVSFQSYCRKCIRETALVRVKNELNLMLMEEAEQFKAKTVQELFATIQEDQAMEQLLMMLIFKNRFWNWLRFGLKDIFMEQRTQPGNKLNSYFNYRFHKLKSKKGFKKISDLVISDIADIVNRFKAEIMKKNVRIFE